MSTNYINILCMIVKNEAHIIKETFESVTTNIVGNKKINYYVINDTGSTDNTIQVITDYFKEKDIKGIVLEHEHRTCKCHDISYKRYDWFHFGWNRTYPLNYCTSHKQKICDDLGFDMANTVIYATVFDADDLIVGTIDIPDDERDCYELVFGSDSTYPRPQIFKITKMLDWHYHDARHEFARTKIRNIKMGIIENDCYIESRRLGDRSKDTEKYLKDALIFEQLIKEYGDHKDNIRRWYYGANSYKDYGNYTKALEMYKKRVKLGDYDQEIFNSYMSIAEIYKIQNREWEEIENMYYSAIKSCPARKSEAFYELAWKYGYEFKDYRKAYELLKKVIKGKYDRRGLFTRKDIYLWRGKLDLAQMCANLGKYDEAFQCFRDIYNANKFRPEQKEQIDIVFKRLCALRNSSTKKNMVFYFGNELVTESSQIINVMNEMSNLNNVYAVGNKINHYISKNIISITPNMLSDLNLTVDYLCLYDSLNYFLDNLNIQPKQITLCINSGTLSYNSNSGIRLAVFNKAVLNKVLKKITKIVCFDYKILNDIKMLYGLDAEFINLSDRTTYMPILSDDSVYELVLHKQLKNTTDGYVLYEPEYIQNLDMSKIDVKLAFYRSLIDDFKNIQQIWSIYVVELIRQSRYTLALNIIDQIYSSNHTEFRDSLDVYRAEIMYYLKQHAESYDLANKMLIRNNLEDDIRLRAERVRDSNIEFISKDFDKYDKLKINSIKSKNGQIKVMFSMTTCKRYDLFIRTMNSFVNNCLDLDMIDYWFVVDDNSLEADRIKMKKNYPFLNFYFKTVEEKGHSISMNIIRDKAIELDADYVVHMEDDFLFVQKRNYITESIAVLAEDDKIGQVLFNNLYAEIEPYKKPCLGGFDKVTADGLRYKIHQHLPGGTRENQVFSEMCNKRGFGNHAYWPHFSFRPSVVRVAMYRTVGPFYQTSHFEMAYAWEYVSYGYVSAFLDTFSCIHIGKKTWEQGTNSYALNKVGQFSLSSDFMNIYAISKGIKEEWNEFKSQAYNNLPFMIRHNYPNVTHLSELETKLFYSNNFNYDRTIVNEIMSHMKIIYNHVIHSTSLSDYVMVIKENVKFAADFKNKFKLLCKKIKKTKFDLLILDNPVIDTSELHLVHTNDKTLNLSNINGYILSKSGINKIIEHLEFNRIKDIDYLTDIDLKTYRLNKELYTYTATEPIKPKTFIDIQGYTFYSNLDCYGGDIGQFQSFKDEPVDVLTDFAEIALANDAVAFNTYGYVKAVADVTQLVYLANRSDAELEKIGGTDGIYIRN